MTTQPSDTRAPALDAAPEILDAWQTYSEDERLSVFESLRHGEASELFLTLKIGRAHV